MSGLDRFLAKPVGVNVKGEIMNIKPFVTKHYPLLSKYQNITIKLLSLIKKNEDIPNSLIQEKTELELEMVFMALSESYPELKREKFDNEISKEVIEPIVEGILTANGMTDEDKEKATEKINKFFEGKK